MGLEENYFQMKKITLSVLLIVFVLSNSISQTWKGDNNKIGEPQNIVLTKNSNNSYTLKWSFNYDKSNIETKQLSVSSKKAPQFFDACGRINSNGDAIRLSESSSKNHFVLTPADNWNWVYLSYVNELDECIYKSFFTLFLPYEDWKKSENNTPKTEKTETKEFVNPNFVPEPTKPQVSTQDGDQFDPTVYVNCVGEYKIGCTDVNGHIKEVQQCLGLPVTGKFGPIMEKKLLAKWGKTTFKPGDIWLICGKSSGQQTTF